MESILPVLIFIHAEVNEVLVVNVDEPHYMALYSRNQAEKVGSMALPLVCINETNIDNYPTCWGCPIFLTESLSLDLELSSGKVNQVHKPCAEEKKSSP
jgi:hypothetical protein